MLLPIYTIAQGLQQQFKIFDVKKQTTIQLSQIIADMEKVNVLFFGEEHNDSVGHMVKLQLFQQLSAAYPTNVALSMEMFHTDVQQVINEYLKGLIDEKNFIKEARAWNNYKDYKPLINFAKNEEITVIGANAATRYSNAVTKHGLVILKQFPAVTQKILPPWQIDTLTGRYYEKFTELLGGHSMGGMKVYQTQNFWDATMAWSIAKFAKKHKGLKLLQVNGRFHSDEYLGTFAQLKKYAPKLKALSISAFAADDFEKPNWKKHEHLADYIILTDPTVKKNF